VCNLINILSDLILNADEISYAASTIVELFSKIFTCTYSDINYTEISENFQLKIDTDIKKFFKKFWRLCLHVSDDVRRNTINALIYIVKFVKIDLSYKDNLDISKFHCYLLFYISLTENDSSIRECCKAVNIIYIHLKAFSSFLECFHLH
ncbi:hypothetical protein MXB_3284, partial [Myxobolus squamalis]